MRAGFPCAKLSSDTKYVFKPGDLSGGNGVHVLPAVKDETSVDKNFLENLGEKLKTAYRVEGCLASHETHFPYLPVIIQRYLHSEDNKASRPVIRVYAIVAANVSHPELKLAIAIDTSSAYCHIRLKQDPNNFTLNNNKHELFEIRPETKEQIRMFLDTFFKELLKDKKQVMYKEWETLANEYITHYKKWSEDKRADNLAQFAAALMQEQSYTQNKLSDAQCDLLNSFLKCYQKKETKLSSPLHLLLTKSFIVLAGANLAPYKDDSNYKLANIVREYYVILLRISPASASAFTASVQQYVQQQKPIKSIEQVPTIKNQEPPRSDTNENSSVANQESPTDDESIDYYRRCIIS